MSKIVLTEDEKRDIREMYSNIKTSKKIMSYLKRNFKFYKPIDFMSFDDESKKEEYINNFPFINDLVKINIYDREYILNNEKKSVKKRLFNVIEDDLNQIDPDATNAVLLKTIKEFIDNIYKYYNLSNG